MIHELHELTRIFNFKKRTKMENNKIYSETLAAAMEARSVLFISRFISDVENEHINQRIREYRERYEADGKMNREYDNVHAT